MKEVFNWIGQLFILSSVAISAITTICCFLFPLNTKEDMQIIALLFLLSVVLMGAGYLFHQYYLKSTMINRDRILYYKHLIEESLDNTKATMENTEKDSADYTTHNDYIALYCGQLSAINTILNQD